MNLIIQTPNNFLDQIHHEIKNVPHIGQEVLVTETNVWTRFSLVVQSVLWDYENNQVFVNVK